MDKYFSNKQEAERVNYISDQLKIVPNEALLRLQYFQTETGCLNACSFCSQLAGHTVWRLSQESQSDLIKAIKQEMKRRNISLLGSKRFSHRPGVLFPYFDNDIASNPYFYDYLRDVYLSLGSKIRFTTVGWSKHNHLLNKMHQKIANELGHAIAGIRFSLTPYTSGWVATRGSKLSRFQYEKDLAFSLSVYKKAMSNDIGIGKTKSCVEIRFHPLIANHKVEVSTIEGKFILKCGPHLIVSCNEGIEMRESKIKLVDDKSVSYTEDPVRCYLITDNQLIGISIEDAYKAIPKRKPNVVSVYKFSNSDGEYFACNPDFSVDGFFNALHIYPETSSRKSTGYNDATRPFMNAILTYKKSLGLKRRDSFMNAGWRDVENVLDILYSEMSIIGNYYSEMEDHYRDNILPIVESYIRILRQSELEPSIFFNSGFTIDTGQIVNQGRARNFFKGLVTLDNHPLTPRESRAFGETSISVNRGKTWRIVPVPQRIRGSGGKNPINENSSIVIHEVSDIDMTPTKRQFFIDGLDIEVVHRSPSLYLQPGLLLI